MATRLEINFIRLLSRCESIASEKRGETEWRLEKVRREGLGVRFIFIALRQRTLKGLLLFVAAVSHVVTEASQHIIMLFKLTTQDMCQKSIITSVVGSVASLFSPMFLFDPISLHLFLVCCCAGGDVGGSEEKSQVKSHNFTA